MDTGYKIEKHLDEKKVIIHFAGFTKPEMFQNFIKEYNDLKNTVNVAETNLVLDGKGLKAFSADMEDGLMKLYESYTIFKKIFISNPENVVTKMQVKRVLKKAGIESKFEFIDNVSDAK